jgi:hypothetical protein
MSKRKFNNIENVSLDFIYKIEERVELKLKYKTKEEINKIKDKLNNLSENEKEEIKEINKIIDKRKKKNIFDFSILDEYIVNDHSFTFNSQDFLK